MAYLQLQKCISSVQFLCLKTCVYGGSVAPLGGGEGAWQPSPRGGGGTVSPRVGLDKARRGGGYHEGLRAYVLDTSLEYNGHCS